MSFWSTIWDVIWWFFTVFVSVAYLIALFSIISDLFRDRKLAGGYKALWLIFLIFLPFLTALAYLVFRGRGMGERAQEQAQAAQSQAEQYIRSVANPASPTEQIASAKQLLDSGAITAEEFETLKKAALQQTGA